MAALLTALAAPSAQLLQDHGAPRELVRIAVTVFNWSWPWHIGLVIPLSLLLLPDGRLPSPRWRPLALVVVLTAPLFAVEIGTSPGVALDLPDGYLVLASYDSLSTLWAISEFRLVLSILAGVIALALRYRPGDDQLRRQILWLLAAAAVVLVAVTPFALVAGTPIAVLFTIPLVPIAITVGILRHQLLDIRLVIARGIAYALLSGIVLSVYALLVIALSGVASALVAALAALPLRNALQRSVERLFYGQRSDPLRVASRVGGRLGVGLAAPPSPRSGASSTTSDHPRSTSSASSVRSRRAPRRPVPAVTVPRCGRSSTRRRSFLRCRPRLRWRQTGSPQRR